MKLVLITIEQSTKLIETHISPKINYVYISKHTCAHKNILLKGMHDRSDHQVLKDVTPAFSKFSLISVQTLSLK